MSTTPRAVATFAVFLSTTLCLTAASSAQARATCDARAIVKGSPLLTSSGALHNLRLSRSVTAQPASSKHSTAKVPLLLDVGAHQVLFLRFEVGADGLRRGAIRVETHRALRDRQPIVVGHNGALGWKVESGVVSASVDGRAVDALLPFALPHLLQQVGNGSKAATCRRIKGNPQLSWVRPDGRRLQVLLDDKGMVRRLQLQQRDPEEPQRVVDVVYENSLGVWLPHRLTWTTPAGDRMQLMTTSVDVNPGIDPRFVHTPYALMSQQPTQL